MPWTNQMTYIASAGLVKRSFAPNSASLVVRVSEILPYCWFRAPAATSCVNHWEVLFIYPLILFERRFSSSVKYLGCFENVIFLTRSLRSWTDDAQCDHQLGPKRCMCTPMRLQSEISFRMQACVHARANHELSPSHNNIRTRSPSKALSPNVPQNLKASKII